MSKTIFAIVLMSIILLTGTIGFSPNAYALTGGFEPDITVPGTQIGVGERVTLTIATDDFVGVHGDSTIDWGDGVVDSIPRTVFGDTVSLSHSYSSSGFFTINLTVFACDLGIDPLCEVLVPAIADSYTFEVTKPDIIIDPLADIDFGAVLIGETSSSNVLTVANIGSANLIVDMSINGVDSSEFNIVSNNCGEFIAPSESCNVELSFTPTSVGTKEASLTVLSNDLEDPAILVNLLGNGISDNIVDSDGDGVPDIDDICEGFDDNVDTDGNGIPDGCDIEVVPLSCGDGTIQQGNECVVDPTITQQLSDLEDTLEEKNQEITTLNGIIDALEQTIADLTAQLEDALQTIADLEVGMPWNDNNANEKASPGPVGKKP